MSFRRIETFVDIAAPIPRVWSVLTDFAKYPQWSRFLLAVEGEARAGTYLSVRFDDGGGVMEIRPRLLVCDECSELRWRGVLGTGFLFSGEHWFRLEALPGGGTRLLHGEVFGGLLVPLFWRRLDTCTRRAFQEFNAALRERANGSGER